MTGGQAVGRNIVQRLTRTHDAGRSSFDDAGSKRRQKCIGHILVANQRIESLRLRKLAIFADGRAEIESSKVLASGHSL